MLPVLSDLVAGLRRQVPKVGMMSKYVMNMLHENFNNHFRSANTNSAKVRNLCLSCAW